MLEQSKTALSEATPTERALAEIKALSYLASELEENLIPAEEAKATANAYKDAGGETWLRAVRGIWRACGPRLRLARDRAFHRQRLPGNPLLLGE